MNSLPDKLLREVFSYMEEEELWTCRRVCKDWMDSVDDSLGVDLFLGEPEGMIWANYDGRPFQGLSLIKNYGIQRCFMSSVERESTQTDLDPNLKWKNPEILLYLWIDGFIRPMTLNHLTRDLIQLRTLEIHWSALDSGVDASEIQLDLPNLEVFRLQLFSTRDVMLMSLPAAFVNVIALLRNLTFPALKSVTFNLPFALGWFRHINRIILRFLLRNAKHLKVVQLSYDFMCHLKENCEEFTGLEVSREELLGVLDLDELRIICAPEPNVILNQLDTLTSSQSHLTSIYTHLKHEQKGISIIMPIHNCHQTLVNVQLVFYPRLQQNGDAAEVNLAIFGQCPSLEVLELVCPGDVPKYPPLTTVAALPPTLRVISFANFLLTLTDAKNLVRDQPKLEMFRLFNAGQDGSLGLPVNSLLDMLRERKVKRISLTKSVNEDSLESVPKWDPEIGLLLELLDGIETVRMELNSDGSRYRERLMDLSQTAYPIGVDEPEFFGFHFNDFFGDEAEEVRGGDDGGSSSSDEDDEGGGPGDMEVEENRDDDQGDVDFDELLEDDELMDIMESFGMDD